MRDLVTPLESDLPAGQPVLLSVLDAGDAVPVALPIRGADKVEPVPVVFAGADASAGED